MEIMPLKPQKLNFDFKSLKETPSVKSTSLNYEITDTCEFKKNNKTKKEKNNNKLIFSSIASLSALACGVLLFLKLHKKTVPIIHDKPSLVAAEEKAKELIASLNPEDGAVKYLGSYIDENKTITDLIEKNTFIPAFNRLYDHIRGIGLDKYKGITKAEIVEHTKANKGAKAAVYIHTSEHWHRRYIVSGKDPTIPLTSMDGLKAIAEFESNIKDRVSINAKAVPELIDKLDEFCAKYQGKVCYKTPASVHGWENRHDPITIYFQTELPLTKEIEEELIQLTKDHIRSSDAVLTGLPLGELKASSNGLVSGIAKETYPTQEQMIEDIKKSKEISDYLEIAVKKYYEYDGGRAKASSGQRIAVLAVIEKLLTKKS